MPLFGPKENEYIPRADYDLDGKVDDFEMGLFLHEMEEEDKAIAEGKAFFGSASSQVSFAVTIDSDEEDDEAEDEFEDEEEIELDRDYSLDAKLQEYQQRIDAMIDELHQILDAEEEFVDDGYDKYGETDRYEQAENNVSNLEETISNLEDASFNLGMAST